MTDADEAHLRHMINQQELAITELNNRLRVHDEVMQEAIHEADELHRSLASTFLRMVNSRMVRK